MAIFEVKEEKQNILLDNILPNESKINLDYQNFFLENQNDNKLNKDFEYILVSVINKDKKNRKLVFVENIIQNSLSKALVETSNLTTRIKGSSKNIRQLNENDIGKRFIFDGELMIEQDRDATIFQLSKNLVNIISMYKDNQENSALENKILREMLHNAFVVVGKGIDEKLNLGVVKSKYYPDFLTDFENLRITEFLLKYEPLYDNFINENKMLVKLAKELQK